MLLSTELRGQLTSQDLNQCDVVLRYKGCCQFILLEKLEPGETVQEDISLDVVEAPQDSTPATPVPIRARLKFNGKQLI